MSGFKYNKFDKDIPRTIRNDHNKIYPLYKNIEPDLIMLSSRMYDIEQDFIIPECNNLEMSLSQTVNMSRKIINKYLGINYLIYFEEMIKRDKIIFYDEKDAALRDKYDGGIGSIYSGISDEIFIPLKNNIGDVYFLCHEFIHSLPDDEIYIILSDLLAEIGPLFMELLILDYLTETTKNDSSCYANFIERIIDNYKTNYSIINETVDSDSIYTYRSYAYDIANVISAQMYIKYLNDKDKYLVNFKKFILNVGKFDFNKSMKILGLNIRFINGELKYDYSFFEELMNSYQEYVKMVEKKDITLIKTKNRR